MEVSFFCVFKRALLFLSLHVLMTCFMLKGYTYGVEGKTAGHTVSVSSLFPSPSCSPSTAKASNRKSTLEVVHKDGPCSPLVHDYKPLNITEILLQDESRVKWIQSQSSHSGNGLKASAAASLPAKPQSVGNYVVTIGLGTPKKDLTLIFDTGSSITWTQCKPCVGSCYTQSDPIFDPSQSSSYANISCASTICSLAGSGCFGSTCKYSILYGDNSCTVGFLATEKLAISPTEVIDNFQFGCGEKNAGIFGSAAGLIGLSNNIISIVEQSAAKYGKYFSYCLPSSPSSTGYLTFGKDSGSLSSVRFTPLSKVQQASDFYGISIVGISVSGIPLSIPSTVFSSAGAIIDLGTTITQLPPTVYSALRTAFRKAMSSYTTAPAVSSLDTCYDLSKERNVVLPPIKFSFVGGVDVDLDPSEILFGVTTSQSCLAFVANGADNDLVIYGNSQQKRFEVVYDVAGGKLGFGPNGCP